MEKPELSVPLTFAAVYSYNQMLIHDKISLSKQHVVHNIKGFQRNNEALEKLIKIQKTFIN